jgi:hypothetical protein
VWGCAGWGGGNKKNTTNNKGNQILKKTLDQPPIIVTETDKHKSKGTICCNQTNKP